jgi:hypothetical protein
MPRSDLGKLARIKVDIPNSLDHLWSLDIKKSSAVPPTVVRDRLKQLAGAMVEPSVRIHEYRGRKDKREEKIVRVWDLIVDRDTFRFEINREHPEIGNLAASLDPLQISQLEQVFRIIEETFPTQDVHNRISLDQVPAQTTADTDQWKEALLKFWQITNEGTESSYSFMERMVTIEPWNRFAHEKQAIADWMTTQRELRNE